MFTDVLIYTIIIPIIPTALVSRAGVLEKDAQYWVSILLAVYGFTLLIASPVLGYFADYYQSRRPPFLSGLLALAISTGLFAAAHSPAALVVARVFQGLSAAVVWVIGLALVVDRVQQDRIGQAMGMTTVGMTMGSFLGPTVGGVMYEKLGYYQAFLLPIALIILDIVLRLSMRDSPTMKIAQKFNEYIPSEEEQVQRNNYGTISSRDCLPPNTSGTDEESALLGSSNFAGSTTVAGNKSPVFQMLCSARLLVALIVTVVVAIGLTAFETTLPLFVMKTFDWSSRGAGLIFLSFSVPSLAGSFAGKLVDQFGARRPGFVTGTVTGAATICLRFVQSNTTTDKVLLTGLLAIIGLGILVLQIIAMTEVSMVVYEREGESIGKSPIALAYALFNMAYAAGQLVGPILAGLLRVHAGWKTMTLVFGISWLLAAVPITFFSGSSQHETGDVEAEGESVTRR
ncbi:transporter [Aspergillus sclerotialis]|uniref:Transporter n=1 Tax=Aspergillus sclerotialis TaxID=2070753 RepID=A0A3A2ZZ48_9EURO|nr:transporter [Aspergillus sclerotialis]